MHSVRYLGKQFIEIKSISTSPDTAFKNVENVQQYTINYLQEIESSRTAIQTNIDSNYRNIDNLELKLISFTNQIQTDALYLDEFKTLLKEVEEKIKISKSSDYDLSSRILLLSEKRELSELITIQMNELESKKYEINVMKSLKINYENGIQRDLDKITQLKSSFNTASEITTKQLPARKLLIIIASFVAGFFLSIFVVFIRQAFLQEQK